MGLSVRGVAAPGEDRTPIVLAHGAANSACVWTFWAGGAGSAWLVLLGPCPSNTSPGGRRMPRNVTSFSRSLNKRSGTACGQPNSWRSATERSSTRSKIWVSLRRAGLLGDYVACALEIGIDALS